MTLLWLASSSVIGPFYDFARVIALLKRPRITFPFYPRAVKHLKKTLFAVVYWFQRTIG